MVDFQIESVGVRTRTIKDHIRGTWRIGDIVSGAFRRKISYERRERQRFHYDTRRTTEVFTAPVDQIREYFDLLGVERGASQKDIKSAYRKRAKELHPDTSPSPRNRSRTTLQRTE